MLRCLASSYFLRAWPSIQTGPMRVTGILLLGVGWVAAPLFVSSIAAGGCSWSVSLAALKENTVRGKQSCTSQPRDDWECSAWLVQESAGRAYSVSLASVTVLVKCFSYARLSMTGSALLDMSAICRVRHHGHTERPHGLVIVIVISNCKTSQVDLFGCASYLKGLCSSYRTFW